MILAEWMDLVERQWKGARFHQEDGATVAPILLGQLEVGCWVDGFCEVLDPNARYTDMVAA